MSTTTPLDPLDDMFPPEPFMSIIGHITHSLSHVADMLVYIDEYQQGPTTSLRNACMDSFLLHFRMLYNFLLGPRGGRHGIGGDAHSHDFLETSTWPRPKTVATKRMKVLADFMSKYRAHLSRGRFVPIYQSLEDILGVRRLTAEFLARTLLDYLDVLDDFIGHLPDTRESGKRAWQGAAYSARYKTEVRLGIRPSDFPDNDSLRPFKNLGPATP